MLFSQVFSIFLRVLCEVVTHRKTIIGSAKAAPAGRKVYRNAGEQPSYTQLTGFVVQGPCASQC